MGSVDADGGHEEKHEAQEAKPPRDAIFQRLGIIQNDKMKVESEWKQTYSDSTSWWLRHQFERWYARLNLDYFSKDRGEHKKHLNPLPRSSQLFVTPLPLKLSKYAKMTQIFHKTNDQHPLNEGTANSWKITSFAWRSQVVQKFLKK